MGKYTAFESSFEMVIGPDMLDGTCTTIENKDKIHCLQQYKFEKIIYKSSGFTMVA
jgi:hypothetical protein